MFKCFYAVILGSLSKWGLSLPLAKLLLNVKGTLRIPAYYREGEWLSVIAEGVHSRGCSRGRLQNFLPAIAPPVKIIRGGKVRREVWPFS